MPWADSVPPAPRPYDLKDDEDSIPGSHFPQGFAFDLPAFGLQSNLLQDPFCVDPLHSASPQDPWELLQSFMGVSNFNEMETTPRPMDVHEDKDTEPEIVKKNKPARKKQRCEV